MRDRFLKSTHPVHVGPNTVLAANEDIFNGNIAGDVVSLKNAGAAIITVITNANAGGNATLRILACDDTTPTTTVPIAFRYRQIESPDTQRPVSDATSAGFATSTGANIIYQIEVDPVEVAEQGYEYFQFIATEKTNAAVDGAVFCELVDIAYVKDGGMTTQVS